VTTKNSNSQSAVSPARAAAFDILLRVERESSYASELLIRGHTTGSRLSITPDNRMGDGRLRWRSLWIHKSPKSRRNRSPASIPKSLPHCGSRFSQLAGSVAFQRAQL